MRTTRLKAVAAVSAALLTCGLVAGCGSSGSESSSGSNTEGGGSSPAATGGGGSSPATTEASSGGGSGGGGAKTITIPIASGWAEDVAVTNLWKYILEQRGWTVNTSELDVGIIFNGISRGENAKADLFFDTWLPKTHHKYWVKIKDKVEDIGIWYDQATLNLAVPKYMKIDSMSQLKSVGDELKNTITGIDPSAGEMGVVKNDMMPAYGLQDWTLKPSSGSAMLAALKGAISRKEPIVVTLWHPHWAYSTFPIKDLKDPKGAMGKAEKIHVIGREGFSKDYPSLYKALQTFTINDQLLGTLESQVIKKHKDDPQAGVKEWVSKNQDYVKKITKALGS